MNILQQLKQHELNLDYPEEDIPRDFSSEMYIATYLSESPTGKKMGCFSQALNCLISRTAIYAIRMSGGVRGTPREGRSYLNLIFILFSYKYSGSRSRPLSHSIVSKHT